MNISLIFGSALLALPIDRAIPPITTVQQSPGINVRVSLPPMASVKMVIPQYFEPCYPRMIEIASVESVMDVFGGPEGLKDVLSCERIEIGVLSKVAVGSGARQVADGDWKVLESADVSLLRALLVSDASYDWDEDYDFFENHNVRVRFVCEKRSIFVDIDLATQSVCPVISEDVFGRSIRPKFSEIIGLVFKYLFRDPKVSDEFSEWIASR